MASYALSGQDTITLNNRVLADLPDGSPAELTYPNETASVKTGKNGNSIYGYNASGEQAELKLRVLRGSADDKWLNNLRAQQKANFAGTVLLSGQIVKKVGDGSGNITSDTYVLSGGVFTKNNEAKVNVEGDTEQSVTQYVIKFSSAPRALT